jgi:hypothetical protein
VKEIKSKYKVNTDLLLTTLHFIYYRPNKYISHLTEFNHNRTLKNQTIYIHSTREKMKNGVIPAQVDGRS